MRFVALDSWRGVCALLVAVYHLQALGHIYHVPLVRHAFLFVDFFFVLSGFVITHAYVDKLHSCADLRSFIIRRFGRLWPLQTAVLIAFVVAEAVNLMLAMAVGLKTGRPPFDPEGYRPLASIPLHLLLLQAVDITDRLTWNFPSWSISAEFWTYLVFASICFFFPRRKTALLVAAGFASATVVVWFSKRGIEVTYDLGFLRCLYGFSVGHLVYRFRSESPGVPEKHAAAAEVSALTAVLAFVWVAGYGQLSLLAPIVFGATVFVFSFESGPISQLLKIRPFELLGDLSYSIYMVHAFVAALIWVGITVLQRFAGKSLFVDFDGDGTAGRAIANVDPFLLDGLYILYVAATIALSALTYRLIETPGRRLFARLAVSVNNQFRSNSPRAVAST